MIAWVRANAAWLQSIVVAGLALADDFGFKLTAAQLADTVALTAIVLGVAAHAAQPSAPPPISIDRPPKQP